MKQLTKDQTKRLDELVVNILHSSTVEQGFMYARILETDLKRFKEMKEPYNISDKYNRAIDAYYTINAEYLKINE